MSTLRFGDPTTWWRLAYNHNPFYVISAGLVLYGLHTSFTNSVSPADGWTMLAIYCGYMLMLALAAVIYLSVVTHRNGFLFSSTRTS